jgi:hypothetical protein
MAANTFYFLCFLYFPDVLAFCLRAYSEVMNQSVLYHPLLRSSQELPADYDRRVVPLRHFGITRTCLLKAHLLPCFGVFLER